MDIKTFFEPTISKLILPISFLLYTIYSDLFAPLWCGNYCPSVAERFVSSITNIEHVSIVWAVTFMLYVISHSVISFVNQIKNKIT